MDVLVICKHKNDVRELSKRGVRFRRWWEGGWRRRRLRRRCRLRRVRVRCWLREDAFVSTHVAFASRSWRVRGDVSSDIAIVHSLMVRPGRALGTRGTFSTALLVVRDIYKVRKRGRFIHQAVEEQERSEGQRRRRKP
jgi:hypothetical protein